jgi:hypothetical protein
MPIGKVNSMKQKRCSNLEKVMNSVVRTRKAGEGPEQSLHSFDEFECDLCKGIVPRKGITQCGFCGRWICKESCWNEENMACISCAGIIILSKNSGDFDDTDCEHTEHQKNTVKENLKKTGNKVKNALKTSTD